MVCINLTDNILPCASNSGGVSYLWIFDVYDFKFFTTAPTTGRPYPLYDNIGALGGAHLYKCQFQIKSAKFETKQTGSKMANKWETVIEADLPRMSNGLVNFMANIQSGVSNFGVGVIVGDNNGKFWVINEKNIAGETNPILQKFVLDGAEATTGKTFDEQNMFKLSIKGDYIRPPLELYKTSSAYTLSMLRALET